MPSLVRNQHSPRLLSVVSSPETTDADVARALISGEAWAVAETWHRFAPMVLKLSERCLGSRAEADDLTQEVFYRLYRKVHTLREPAKLRSFVYSFAIRLLKSELRRRKARAWLSFDRSESLEEVQCETHDVESGELLQRFQVLLDRLSARDRLAFILRRMESMTVEEIATHMNLSPSTVKRSIQHASGRLARWVEADPKLSEGLGVEGPLS